MLPELRTKTNILLHCNQ